MSSPRYKFECYVCPNSRAEVSLIAYVSSICIEWRSELHGKLAMGFESLGAKSSVAGVGLDGRGFFRCMWRVFAWNGNSRCFILWVLNLLLNVAHKWYGSLRWVLKSRT